MHPPSWTGRTRSPGCAHFTTETAEEQSGLHHGPLWEDPDRTRVRRGRTRARRSPVLTDPRVLGRVSEHHTNPWRTDEFPARGAARRERVPALRELPEGFGFISERAVDLREENSRLDDSRGLAVLAYLTALRAAFLARVFFAGGIGAATVLRSSWTRLVTNFRQPFWSNSIVVCAELTLVIVPRP